MSIRRTARGLAVLVVVGAVLGLLPQRADAAPFTAATNIDTSAVNSCAVAGGQVYCWGENLEGQVGDGGNLDRSQPTPVVGVDFDGLLDDATQVAVGNEFACALLVDQQVRCWGRNHAGQLGDGSTSDSNTPVEVRNAGDTGPLTNITQLVVGASHACARRTDGQVRCWGAGFFGGLGNDDNESSSLPIATVDVDGEGPLTGVVQLTAGTQHTCARLSNKQVRCWGGGSQGQLGYGGNSIAVDRPVVVLRVDGTAPIGNVVGITAGANHTCARLANGQARCWGDGQFGKLGEQHTDDRYLPIVVEHPGADVESGLDNTRLTGITQISAGGSHTCFRMANARVRCVGQNQQGQLGAPAAGAHHGVPLVVRNGTDTGPLQGVAQVAAGGGHTCVRFTGGTAACFGDDSSGQLGNGGLNQDADLPTLVVAA